MCVFACIFRFLPFDFDNTEHLIRCDDKWLCGFSLTLIICSVRLGCLHFTQTLSSWPSITTHPPWRNRLSTCEDGKIDKFTNRSTNVCTNRIPNYQMDFCSGQNRRFLWDIIDYHAFCQSKIGLFFICGLTENGRWKSTGCSHRYMASKFISKWSHRAKKKTTFVTIKNLKTY